MVYIRVRDEREAKGNETDVKGDRYMKVSVVVATYNRGELLRNALRTYERQDIGVTEWEYLLCDDGSEDDTWEVIEEYRKKFILRAYKASELGLPKEAGKWRDGCKLRNALSLLASGEVIIGTHPEIMIPPSALQEMYDSVMSQPNAWHTAIPYWLPDVGVGKLRKWKRDLWSLREVDGFYDPNWPPKSHSPGAIDYTNNNQEVRSTWESEVFWGMTMKLWRYIGGFREFETWGSVDMDFLARRKALSIPTVLVKSKDSPHKNSVLMVFHQYHESKRDMDAAIQALHGAKYSNPEEARKAGGLYMFYNHGPRERAENGSEGILEDHLARYRFARNYSANKVILDVPCGTGYGASILDNVKEYIGVDIDAEAIAHAREHYFGKFMTGDMRKLHDISDESIDLLLTFEGIEHLATHEDQQVFVYEMHRVLKNGGTFILSTPQKGAARGTQWDINILSLEQLMGLFDEERWKNLDLFYQVSYGSKDEPKPGKPPKHAEIMVLGGTKKELR